MAARRSVWVGGSGVPQAKKVKDRDGGKNIIGYVKCMMPHVDRIEGLEAHGSIRIQYNSTAPSSLPPCSLL